MRWPAGESPTSGMTPKSVDEFSQMDEFTLVAKNRGLVGSVGSAAATNACPASPTATPLHDPGEPGNGVATICTMYPDLVTVLALVRSGDRNAWLLPGGAMPSVVRFGA